MCYTHNNTIMPNAFGFFYLDLSPLQIFFLIKIDVAYKGYSALLNNVPLKIVSPPRAKRQKS